MDQPRANVKKFQERLGRMAMLQEAAKLISGFAVLLAALSGATAAQEHQHVEEPPAEHLGAVSFPISCTPRTQSSFNRGVALLHSFGYRAAQRQFEEIAQQDPACAMAYWGQAMSLYHQLWDRPSASDLLKGYELVQKAQAAGAKTERERGYIQAAAEFYKKGSNVTYDARTQAYSEALERLHNRFPKDDEAAVFYALSLLASPHANDNDLAYHKKSVAILETVLQKEPNHPGVAHYLIHACDNPRMAAKGLPAARHYAQIAPSSPHALHMPSHIFARVGLWPEDIQSNLQSVAAAERQSATQERLHAMSFLEYAYLQLGQTGKARAIEQRALDVRKAEFGGERQDYFYYVQVRFPALLALEMRDWRTALTLEPPSDAGPDFQAVIFRARAIAAGHLRDAKQASNAAKLYDQALAAVRHTSYAYVADSMVAERDETHAWCSFAERRKSEAIQLMTEVANKQDQLGKGEIEIPAREMLADMLLALNRPQEALAQYADSLRVDPNRFNSLAGAARAAKLAGQPASANDYYRRLLNGRNSADGSDRPELAEAAAYLKRAHE